MRLNKTQAETLSQYFADLSKILIGSTVVGFFFPSSTGIISLPVFLTGSLVALACLMFSIRLLK